ncbi:MAG: AAA family ATPase [Chloroflexota bacterium]
MSQLPDMIQALLSPQAYPDPPEHIELVQTQMSFVLLAGELVYKIKKPVDLGYLDYTTLDRRRFYCQQEVELNRRLCAEAYLGVVPVVRRQGRYFLEGKGKALEYAVKMRRLPREAMMDVLLAEGRLSPPMVAGVAERLAEFHSRAQTSETISAFGSLEAISGNAEENFSQTVKYIGSTIAQQNYRRIKDYSEGFIRDNADLFRQRADGGRIRDCHGDLHAAHICFSTGGICIYDCIEFNDRFRYCDVASEIAFLAMDLDHYGRADLSNHFVSAYAAQSHDSELKRLLNFYKCYRAYVRGKVACFNLDDPYVGLEEREAARKAAASYFDLAHAYTRPKPLLLITVGLAGSGKSTLAQALAGMLGLVVISSDVTRKQLADIPLTERRFEDFDSGIYSAEFSRRTYDSMLARAEAALRAGSPVILDASFIKSAERLRAKRLAQDANADFFILECRLDDAGLRQRLAQRLKQGSVSDGRPEILEPQKQRFDPVDEAEAAGHIVLDATLPTEGQVSQVMDRIS